MSVTKKKLFKNALAAATVFVGDCDLDVLFGDDILNNTDIKSLDEIQKLAKTTLQNLMFSSDGIYDNYAKEERKRKRRGF